MGNTHCFIFLKTWTSLNLWLTEGIIQQFYCNLQCDVGIKGSSNFHRVKVQGKHSPHIINKFLENPGIHYDCTNDYNKIVNVITIRGTYPHYVQRKLSKQKLTAYCLLLEESKYIFTTYWFIFTFLGEFDKPLKIFVFIENENFYHLIF